MRRISLALLAVLFPLCMFAEADLTYYLPDESFDQNIPEPAAFIGHEVGEWHLTHDKLSYYLQELAKKSDRIEYQEYARSWEGRPLFHLLITSPGNHARIDEIRQEHLQLSNPAESDRLDLSSMPLVVRMGYNVHGNESSASNSSVLMAYYLAASSAASTMEWLDNMVILIDPCLNPDGFNRHASWVNHHKSRIPMRDDISRGFREAWPGGRTNHYWFDLNRDWLLLVHPESRGRVKVFHDWKPNVQTDHHEMGPSEHFFFQPGEPSRVNPLTPEVVSQLTGKIGSYHQEALDEIGSIYFTEERFDDFYYGKGSSYPDVCGGIGILFEQAQTRGFERNTLNGIITFPFGIRNQVTVSFSTLKASYEMREELLEHQRTFNKDYIKIYRNTPVKAYVCQPGDPSTAAAFINFLRQHKIRVNRLNQDLVSGGYTYREENSYLVSLDQPQIRLAKSLFEPVTSFRDSVFYDVSAWTLPYAMNIRYAGLSVQKQVTAVMGDLIEEADNPSGKLIDTDHPVGFILPWTDLYAPKALYKLQDMGLRTLVCQEKLQVDVEGQILEIMPGSIFIPAYKQEHSPEEIAGIMKSLAGKSGLDIHALPTSLSNAGPDLGSRTILHLEKPRALLLSGSGVSSGQAGEIWHHLDTRMDMPVALIEPGQLNSMDLSGYTHLIMPSGIYRGISKSGISELERWLKHGGCIIALGSASRWLTEKNLARIRFLSTSRDSVGPLPYKDALARAGASRIPGTFFLARLDLSHPINFGVPDDEMAIFKRSGMIAGMDKRPYAYPVRYTDDPLLSGYVPGKIYPQLQGTPAVIIDGHGRGRIISFIDDPNFRGIMYGTSRLFMNAVFFGPVIPYFTIQ